MIDHYKININSLPHQTVNGNLDKLFDLKTIHIQHQKKQLIDHYKININSLPHQTVNGNLDKLFDLKTIHIQHQKKYQLIVKLQIQNLMK